MLSRREILAVPVISGLLKFLAFSQWSDDFEEFFVKEVQPFLTPTLSLESFRIYSKMFAEARNHGSEFNVVRVFDPNGLPAGGREFFITLLLYTRMIYKDNSKKMKMVCPTFDYIRHIINDIQTIFMKNQSLEKLLRVETGGYGINFSSSGQAILKKDLKYYSHIFLLGAAKFDGQYVPLTDLRIKIVSLEDFSN